MTKFKRKRGNGRLAKLNVKAKIALVGVGILTLIFLALSRFGYLIAIIGGGRDCFDGSSWYHSPFYIVNSRNICRGKRTFLSDQLQSIERLIINQAKTKRTHAIVVPYRDRKHHLDNFEKYMGYFLEHHFDPRMDEFVLWVIEQDNNEPFNRAFLMNVGLREIISSLSLNRNSGTEIGCVVLHDVDLVPSFFSLVPYTSCVKPIQLGSELQNHGWDIPYQKFTGAVTSMHIEHWKLVNGMSNSYLGWGGEDDDLYLRLLFHGLLDCDNDPPLVARPDRGKGLFVTVNQDPQYHTRGPSQFRDASKILCSWIDHGPVKGKDLSKVDGLSFLAYNVTRKHTSSLNGFAAKNHVLVQPYYPKMLAEVDEFF